MKTDLRATFIDTLIELAEKDERVVLLVPDVGFNFLEKFQAQFPARFINTGVTEQSTMIIAAGLALAGMKPYVYSMINFVLFRPAEMVRNAVVQHNADVQIFGVKGSEKYKFLGFSHNLLHSGEDTRFCENIGLLSFLPQTPEELKGQMLANYKNTKPTYTRI